MEKQVNSQNTSKGTAGFVLSLIGLILVFFPYVGIILSILGLIFSIKQRKINKTGLSTAGLVIGIIGIIINIIVLILTIFVIISIIPNLPAAGTYNFSS